MLLITCKEELKHKWIKHFLLSAAAPGNVNDNNKANNIIFTIKNTKLYVLVVTLSALKLSKQFSKGFERSVYQNEYKTQNENKNTTNKYRFFYDIFLIFRWS